MHCNGNRLLFLAAMITVICVGPLMANKTMIFVVDVSGSMTAGGLARPVAKSLATFIGNEFADGDNLILCSFGDSFYKNREVIGGRKADLLPVIEGLNFSDDWTYMTLALSEAAKIANDLRGRFPGTPIYIYLYTDGKNDPPQFVKNPLTFDQIMEFLFKGYEPAGTYLYVVTLGTEPDEPVVELVNKLNKVEQGKAQTVTVPVPAKGKGNEVSVPAPPKPQGEMESVTEKRKPVSVGVIFGGIGGLLVVLAVIWWLRARPKFPEGAYLAEVDESGNTLNSYELRRRQKPGSNKLQVSGDIDIVGVNKGSFVLLAERGGSVIILSRSKDSVVKMVSTNEELLVGQRQVLGNGDELTVSGVKLRYQNDAMVNA